MRLALLRSSQPWIVQHDASMMDCMKLMVEKNCDGLAVVNDEGEFIGEVRIEDVRNCFYFEVVKDEAEVEEVKRVVRMTIVAVNKAKREKMENLGGLSPVISPSAQKRSLLYAANR